MQRYPGLNDITLRQFDLIAYKAKVTQFPELTPRAFDISQSIERMSSDAVAAKTLTENSEVYLAHLCRCAIGSEALQMHGVSLWGSAPQVVRGPRGCQAEAGWQCISYVASYSCCTDNDRDFGHGIFEERLHCWASTH